MTRKSQKDEERLWVQDASTRLGAGWHIERREGEEEKPDFIITDGNSRFGLEISAAHIDEISENYDGLRRGSRARQKESEKQKIISKLQQEYKQKNGCPLAVKFRGPLTDDIKGQIIPKLTEIDFGPKPIGYQTVIDLGTGGFRLHVTKSIHPHWYDMNSRVGWVNQTPHNIISHVIECKSNKLTTYRTNSGLSDIRLLIVANRIHKSGKLRLRHPNKFNLHGFGAVYFLSYPENITVFDGQ